MKVILLGYMGCGKSTIGKKLSEKLQIPHFDLDDLIEKEVGMPIPSIFLTKGEIYFRKIEHDLFKKMIDNTDSFVLSLGGGTPCYAENHLLLQNATIISIYLKASIATLLNRLKNESLHRPLIANLKENEQKEFIAKNLFERNYFYNFSSKKISVDNKNIDEIVQEIIDITNSK